ncbi:MAG: peptidoglycan recognition family protein [Cyanobacteriota bacterium]
MKQKLIATILLFYFCFVVAIFTTSMGRSDRANANEFGVPNQSSAPSAIAQSNLAPPMQSSCPVRPENNKTISNQAIPNDFVQVTLSRFRRIGDESKLSTEESLIERSSSALNNYKPVESIVLADPTNYGERFLTDLYGRPAQYPPIVVIHETVGSARSALNLFQTPHPLDSQQVSYHALIKRSGEVIYIVPPDLRAFGAGNSVFEGENGSETVQTNPGLLPSVNNFAYHVSLETPPDGNNNRSRHRGYTKAQYQSLAWLVAKTGVPDSRITTHKGVDRSGQRRDPRSFNQQAFWKLLKEQPRTNEIIIGCQPKSNSRFPLN